MSDAVFGIMVSMKQNGFTVIELLLVIVLLGVGSWLFFNEKATIDATARDNQRKVAINAMYYGLEEYFYAKNGYYPALIDSKTLRTVDPALFTDPKGKKLGSSGSNYVYESTGCNNENRCTGYTLRSSMEREDTYTKTNRDHKK
jgi:prepilin-type N-terminal cleavage/methylation domain-containing protein